VSLDFELNARGALILVVDAIVTPQDLLLARCLLFSKDVASAT